MAVEQDIAKNKIFFGGAAQIPFEVYTDDSLVTPLSLTAISLEFVVRQEYSSADALITLISGSGITHFDQGTNPGEGTIDLEDDHTLAFIDLGIQGIEDYVYTLRDATNDRILNYGKFPIKLVTTR